LRGVVRNEGKFPQINVHFAFCWFVGIRGRNTAAALAKSPLAALIILMLESHGSKASEPSIQVYFNLSEPPQYIVYL